MTQLVATALTMVNAPSAEVHAALRDYCEVRPHLLTAEFGGYQVVAGGRGKGTEVRWNLDLDQAVRNRKGKRPRPSRRPPREFSIRVEEPEPELLVERDISDTLVATWTLRAAEDGRTAVRVTVTWEHAGGVFSRQRDQLALRIVYEGVLTKLHEYFEPDEPAAPEPGAGSGDASASGSH